MTHDQLPRLTAKLSSWAAGLLKNRVVLDGIIREFGSPVNVHHIDPFRRNLAEFQEVLSSALDAWQLFYSCKANRCPEFVAAACEDGFGVDAGSFEELQQALLVGAGAETAIVTAAVKTKETIDLALSRNVLLILDNRDEVELVAERAIRLGQNARIGLRLSGFPHQGKELQSRFGFQCGEIEEILALLKDYPMLQFEGVHFHLSGYDLEERLSALDFIFGFEALFQTRLRFIDIGGGIPVCYLESEAEWRVFQSVFLDSLLGNRPPITFGNNPLGCLPQKQNIEKTRSIYPYWNNLFKADYLHALLTSKLLNGRTVAESFNDRGIEFRCEPGRALLDQCGLTIARVAFRKPAPEGRYFVGLEMNFSQLASSSADFLVDPVVCSSSTELRPVEVYFVGNFSLERDLILKRAIALDRLPLVGDLVVFPNTAGYMMHLQETAGHRSGFAKNIWPDSLSFAHVT